MSNEHIKSTERTMIQYNSIEDIIRRPNGPQYYMDQLIGSTGTDVVQCLYTLGKDTKQSLIRACSVSNLEAVEFLLSVNAPIEDAGILFSCHSLQVFTRVLKELCSRNIDINVSDGDNVFLSLCAENKDDYIMEMYNHGANIHAKDFIGNAISNACWGGPNPRIRKSIEERTKTVQMLINIGVRPIPDALGNNPLHYLHVGSDDILIDILLTSFPTLRYAINNAGYIAFNEPRILKKILNDKINNDDDDEFNDDENDEDTFNYKDYSETFRYLQTTEVPCC